MPFYNKSMHVYSLIQFGKPNTVLSLDSLSLRRFTIQSDTKAAGQSQKAIYIVEKRSQDHSHCGAKAKQGTSHHRIMYNYIENVLYTHLMHIHYEGQ